MLLSVSFFLWQYSFYNVVFVVVVVFNFIWISLIHVKIDISQLYSNAEWLQSMGKYGGGGCNFIETSIGINDTGLQSEKTFFLNTVFMLFVH